MPSSWPYLKSKADSGHGIEDSCPGGGAGRRETPISQTRIPCDPHPGPQERMSWECSESLLLLHSPTQDDAIAWNEVFLRPGMP